MYLPLFVSWRVVAEVLFISTVLNEILITLATQFLNYVW